MQIPSDISDITSDSAIMKLAHPLRLAAVYPVLKETLEQVLGPRAWHNIKTAYQNPAGTTATMTEALCRNPENHKFQQFIEWSTSMGGGTELGNAYSTLLYLRYVLAPAPYFVIEDPLVELLEHTDIAEDISMAMVHLPYDRFYVEFGKNRTSSLKLINIETGLHILEGAYCEKGPHPKLGDGLYVMLTGSPIGKSNAVDDATHHFFLPTNDPLFSIKEALEQSWALANELSKQQDLVVSPHEYQRNALASLLFLVKALLYVGLPDARRVIHNERTQWAASTKDLKSTAKKAKAEKRARGLVNHILICAPPIQTETAGSVPDGSRTVKIHWRRGHYRLQRHGPQLALSKVILIAPALVNSHLGSAPAPNYLVK